MSVILLSSAEGGVRIHWAGQFLVIENTTGSIAYGCRSVMNAPVKALRVVEVNDQRR